MTTSLGSQALTEGELDRLEEFLGAVGPPAMNLESMDGFFAALISGPEIILPSEYLPHIWGEAPAFASADEAAQIADLILRHLDSMAANLQAALQSPGVYMPVLRVANDGTTPANDWALGFMRGVSTRPYGWHELITSDEFGGPLVPIMILAHEHDPDPAMRPGGILPPKREALLEEMIAGLPKIYRYFEPHRRADARGSMRRTVTKTGRNDKCPCGSGKKYKFCCSMGPTLH